MTPCRSVLWAPFVVLLSACTSIDGAVKGEGAKAKANLARLAPIATELATRAPAAASAVSPLEGRVFVDAAYPEDVTAAVMYAEDLAVPGEMGNVYARIPGTKRISECASLVEHKTMPWDPQDSTRWNASMDGFEAEGILKTCSRVRTLFVLRTLDLVKPDNARLNAALGDAGDADAATTPATESVCRSASARCKFDGGYVKIEVHVFALEPFAHKGAFVIEAESSSTVTLEGSYTSSYLESDLTRQIATAFSQALPKQIAGATVKGIP